MRKVVYAKLQSNVFIPSGVGGIGMDLGSTLPPTGKRLNMEMFEVGDKLLLRVAGIEAYVPNTNVQIAVYGDGPTTESKSSAA